MYFCGVGNALLCFVPRLVGAKVLINVDGEDWARDKWGWFARNYLKISERLACLFANIVVADSEVISERYSKIYGRETIFVPYGSNIVRRPAANQTNPTLKRFGLKPNKYILFVGRLEPENSAHILIKAFGQVDTKMNLVIVGDAPYSSEYQAELKTVADRRVVFTGYLFGPEYAAISQTAYLFVFNRLE